MEQDLYREDMAYINASFLPWEQLHNQTLLITGATGLIGGAIADAVLFRNETCSANIHLIVVSRNEKRMLERFEEYLDKPYFQYICQDVTVPLEGLGQVDYIIHAASKGDSASFVKDPVGIMNANYLGTLHTLELAKKCKSKKLVFISSGETYGIVDKIAESGIRECDSGYIDVSNPRNCYATSKRAAENLCVSYSAEYGVNTSAARLCHTYGGKIMPEETRVIFQFMRNAINGEDIVMKSSGLQERSYCYVADAVKAIFYILLKGQNQQSYNIANKHCVVTIKQLAQYIAEFEGKKVIIKEPDLAEQKGNSGITKAVFDTSKLESLGFQAEYGIEEGIKRTMAIMKNDKFFVPAK